MNSKSQLYHPLVLSVVLIIGILVGGEIGKRVSPQTKFLPIKVLENNKFNDVLQYIEEQYVDTINKEALLESAIISMLDKLDPHSAYIPAREFKRINESMEGNFEGIGIEFNVLHDTIIVVAPISGGPSEKLGIKAGDRIIYIDDELVAGIGFKSSDVVKKLRGTKDSQVSVQILRRGVKNLLSFSIVRDKIPLYCVDVAFMVNKEIGYIKINRFSATTYSEYFKAFVTLRQQGMRKLILDLRGNPGGYLSEAIELADEFLQKNKLIVYTEGRSHPKEMYYATERGSFENDEVVVLIDEGSASASEIIAGALQDNDRAVIVGRRSFGKGLVQNQASLPDKSALRLTIARYYTPTGRCIQRPYSAGTGSYYDDLLSRYEHGELVHEDSIKFDDSLMFKTPAGKIVYGGGGIMPDIFVPMDTARSEIVNALLMKGVIQEFSFDYTDENRAELQAFNSVKEYAKQFKITPQVLNLLKNKAKEKKVKWVSELKDTELKELETYLKAYIARNIWNNDGFYPIILQLDSAFHLAYKQLN